MSTEPFAFFKFTDTFTGTWAWHYFVMTPTKNDPEWAKRSACGGVRSRRLSDEVECPECRQLVNEMFMQGPERLNGIKLRILTGEITTADRVYLAVHNAKVSS